MTTEPKKASDEQIALLREHAELCVEAGANFKCEGVALTAVLDELERYRGVFETPVAWCCFADNGNCIIWSTDAKHVEQVAEKYGRKVTKLYAAPQTEEKEQ